MNKAWYPLVLAVCGVLVSGRPSSHSDGVIRSERHDWGQNEQSTGTPAVAKNNTIIANNESMKQLLTDRLRNKQFRLDSIRSQVLSMVGGVPPNSANLTLASGVLTPRNFLEPNSWSTGDVYPEKGQSFYPTCGLPRNIDAETWTNLQYLNLFFNLSFPSSLEGTSHIVAAKLRLYKKANATHPTEATCSSSNKIEDERNIRVSVYWFAKTQKNQLVKRKLLDSKMVRVAVSQWMEFNIKNAAKAWKNKEHNLGISIQVEDDENNILPARDYLVPMDCGSKASSLRPIPGILVRRLKFNENSSKPIFSDVPLFPVMDLHTMDIPDKPKKSPQEIEALLHHRISSGIIHNNCSEINTNIQDSPVISSSIESSTMVLSLGASGHRHRHKH